MDQYLLGCCGERGRFAAGNHSVGEVSSEMPGKQAVGGLGVAEEEAAG